MIKRFFISLSLTSLLLLPIVVAAAPMKGMGAKVKTVAPAKVLKTKKSMTMPKGKMSGMKGDMKDSMADDMDGFGLGMGSKKNMEEMKKMKKMKQEMERQKRLGVGKAMQDMRAGNKKNSMKKMSGDELAMVEDDDMSDESSMDTTMKKDMARMRRMKKMRRMRTAAAPAASASKTIHSSAVSSDGMSGGADEDMMD